MNARAASHGSAALPAALGAIVVSLALAAAVADVTRVETSLVRSRRTTAEALAAVDTCLARAVGTLDAGWDFAQQLAGRDGLQGTPDDGVLSPIPGCAGARLQPAPGTALPPRALLTVEARAGDGRRAVEAVIGRSARPGVPVVLWLQETPPSGAIAGSLVLDGVDPGSPTDPWAGLAAPTDPGLLDAWVAGEGPRLQQTADTAPPRSSPSPPLAALLTRVGGLGPQGAETLDAIGPPPARLALVQTDLVVPGPLYGAGLLLVQGALDIRGSLHFTGIVVVMGGVRIAGGGQLSIDGALWIGSPSLPVPGLQVDGQLELHHTGPAMASADALVPLPRQAVLLGLRDVG